MDGLKPVTAHIRLPRPGPPPAQPAASTLRNAGDAALLAGILTIAATLRFAFLGQYSLWADEAFVVWVIGHPWGEILPVLRGGDTHPPLYYLLMKAWVGVAGSGDQALRIPSACLGILTVLLTYRLVAQVSSKSVALLSALVVAISPFQIMAAQEARMYPLLAALGVASTLMLAIGGRREGVLPWGAYAVLATLMVYTHYLGGLVLVAHGIWALAWERRKAGAWLASAAIVTLLFAPWAPAFAQQVSQVRALQPVGGLFTLRAGDLLGLFAFGGSLFGTASYFFPGTGPLGEQLIILSPFLLVLWRGIASLIPNRRALALLGLPPVVVIGAMGALPFTRPHDRIFSFLLPFYAAFLAHGVVDVGRRVRWRSSAAAGLLTCGLVLYSLPVLDRYYFEPRNRPFQWREAAALVEGQARSTDVFLYVGDPPRQALSHYLRSRHPSVTLTPVEWVRGGNRQATLNDARLRQLAAEARRVWLITTIPFSPQNPIISQRLFPALRSAFCVAGGWDFGGTWVYLLEATPGRSLAPSSCLAEPGAPTAPR